MVAASAAGLITGFDIVWLCLHLWRRRKSHPVEGIFLAFGITIVLNGDADLPAVFALLGARQCVARRGLGMDDGDYRYPALQLVVVAGVKHVGDEHVQTDSTNVHISCSPAVAIGLEVFLERVERATARLERAGAWPWSGTRGHLAAVVMSMDGHQGKGLRDNVHPLQLEVPVVEEAVLERRCTFTLQ
jgi:hypothetical protein